MNIKEFSSKIKTNYNLFEQGMRKFLYSDYYIISVCLTVFIAWVTRSAIFGFTALIAISCLALITSDDILPLTVNIFGAVLMIFSNKVDSFLFMWPSFIPLGICIVFFVIRNGRHSFKLGKMFFPQLAVTVALLMGGVGVTNATEYLRALPTVLFLGFGVLAVYVLYNHFLKRDEKRDFSIYIARVLAYIGTVVCLELIVVIARSGLYTSLWNTFNWDVGWGNRNNIATYLLFTIPMCFYLSIRHKFSLPYLAIALFQYFCLIMTFSRGGILFGTVECAIALVVSVIKSPNRKQHLLFTGIVFVCALIIYFALFNKINDMFVSLIQRGTGTSGRDLLYIEAVEFFKAHPAFGVGMGHIGTGPCVVNEMQMYWYHSTLFQILASTGIIGLLLYCYFYGERLYLLFKGITKKFNLFVLVAWLGFEGYSMIDTGTMVPFPNMMLVILTCLILELSLNKNSFEGIADSYNAAFYISDKLRGKGIFRKLLPEDLESIEASTKPELSDKQEERA